MCHIYIYIHKYREMNASLRTLHSWRMDPNTSTNVHERRVLVSLFVGYDILQLSLGLCFQRFQSTFGQKTLAVKLDIRACTTVFPTAQRNWLNPAWLVRMGCDASCLQHLGITKGMNASPCLKWSRVVSRITCRASNSATSVTSLETWFSWASLQEFVKNAEVAIIAGYCWYTNQLSNGWERNGMPKYCNG